MKTDDGRLAAGTQPAEVQSERDLFRSAVNRFPGVFNIYDAQRRLQHVNAGTLRVSGLSRAELIGRRDEDVIPPEIWRQYLPCLKDVYATKRPQALELHLPVRFGGSVQLLQFEPVLDARGEICQVLGIATDITDRKRVEANQALLTDVLRVLNRGGGLHGLVADTLGLIRERTGFDAVGLRLRRGEDFPYFEQNGFAEEFLAEENILCAREGRGNIIRDAAGRPLLECTCGLVLSGRTDPSMSCFTESGSFWTNASHALLALQPAADPRTRPRNRCIHAGYRSVGLFPMRAGSGLIGLLQLNDRRQGRFTPNLIAFFESLAQNIGLALQRSLAEESLRELNETLEERVAERTALAEARARQLQKLSVELIEAEERERKRVAELLHEDLQQILAAARMQLLASCRNLPPESMLANVAQLLEESIGRSRRLSHELSPAVLQYGGLVETLQWLFQKLRHQAGLDVRLEAETPQRLETWPLKVFVFRAVQELLLNVVRHAGVKSAHVGLSGGDGCLVVTVSDAGKGFDPAILDCRGETAGLGLLSLGERACYIGGSLAIESAPGRGSRFTLTVPLSLDGG